jgi:hypothetical protein
MSSVFFPIQMYMSTYEQEALMSFMLTPQPFLYCQQFLSNFTNLQHLVLHRILDAGRLADDIPDIARLTKLTRLELLPRS